MLEDRSQFLSQSTKFSMSYDRTSWSRASKNNAGSLMQKERLVFWVHQMFPIAEGLQAFVLNLSKYFYTKLTAYFISSFGILHKYHMKM